MASRSVLFTIGFLFLSILGVAQAGVLFPSLPNTLVVETKINGQDTHQGGLTARYLKDNITVSWYFNSTTNASDANYQKVVVRLCFAAKSAVLRKWRKKNADLSKSKTCYKTIKGMRYYRTGNTTTYTPTKNIPGAFYFIRVFVLNSTDPTAVPAKNAIAYGQSSNANTTTNLFEILPYKGTSTGIYVAVVVFSVTSYVLLFGLFIRERFLKKTE